MRLLLGLGFVVVVVVVVGLAVGRRGWLLRRVVMVGQKQIEKGHRTGSLVAEERSLIQLRRDLPVAESVRLLLRQRDLVCLPLHQKLKAVQSL